MSDIPVGGTRVRTLLIQAAIPSYRLPFVEALRASARLSVTIAAGSAHFQPSVLSAANAAVDRRLRNHFVLGRRLLIQGGLRGLSRKADVYVLELNPRILNSWLFLLIAKVTHRRSVLWGHFNGRSRGEVRPIFLRRWQVRLADGVLAYTYDDARRFALEFPGTPCHVAPNSTERRDDALVLTGRVRADLLYVGRLAVDKDVDLLISAYLLARQTDEIPAHARLVLIGDGPLRGSISARIEAGEIPGVLLRPATFEASELNEAYSTAAAAVCGGYVGLNLTQALLRGVPLVYPADASHAPEIALARQGFNSVAFQPSTPDAAAKAMGEAFAMAASGAVDHRAIREDVEEYSVEGMVDGFAEAVESAARLMQQSQSSKA